jgi:hypothetical protein
MKITILNRNTQKRANYVYCGRGSALGNPFAMNDSSPEERNRVCEAYEAYFNTKVASGKDEAFMGQLRLIWRLGKAHGTVYLGCYCAPQRCHCETIAQFILTHK